MDPITRLDLWLLKGVQRLSDWLYAITSIDNFMIARALFRVSLLCCGLFILTLTLFASPIVFIWIVVMLPMMMVINFSCWICFRMLESNPGFAGTDPLGRRRRLNLTLLLFLILIQFLSPSSGKEVLAPAINTYLNLVVGILFSGYFGSFFLSLYFASCKKPPKKKSWLKEKAEQLAEFFSPRPALSPI